MKQIETVELFPELSSELVELLKTISVEQWNKPSPIKGRTVKDLVSHLIDGSLRRLSIQRDSHSSKAVKVNIESYNDLVDYIQKLNKDWMEITDRFSPRILIDLLEYAEKELYDFLKTLHPKDKAIFSVAWAGEQESENWFDIAREYTEKWHHQMQIRMSLDMPLLMDIKYIKPLYDTFMLGLPYLYSNFKDYRPGEKIKISLTGTLNQCWILEKQSKKWVFIDDKSEKINTSVEIPDDIAWIIFTNTDREKEKYKSQIKFDGDDRIGLKILDFVTVIS